MNQLIVIMLDEINKKIKIKEISDRKPTFSDKNKMDAPFET